MTYALRAAAAVSAGLLLIGGAGTLSYWTDEGAAPGVDLTTGEISMSDVGCPTAWQLDGSDLAATDQLVPGDVVTRSCSFTLTLEGANAGATLDVAAPTFDAASDTDLVAQLAPSATYTIDGAAVPATLTGANDGDTVVAELAVGFTDLGDPADVLPGDLTDPAVNQNLTNTSGLSAALDDVTVTLTQLP